MYERIKNSFFIPGLDDARSGNRQKTGSAIKNAPD
jgi:hypothetical protein